jgi:hypothetical protein
VLKVAAQEKAFRYSSFLAQVARGERCAKKLDVEIGVMVFVLQFAPQDFVSIPEAARSSITRRFRQNIAARRSTGRSRVLAKRRPRPSSA